MKVELNLREMLDEFLPEASSFSPEKYLEEILNITVADGYAYFRFDLPSTLNQGSEIEDAESELTKIIESDGK